MGVVDGLSKTRMLAIEAASVIGGSISSGHLILTKFDGSTIDAGNVVGPAASINSGAPGSPISGQMFFDSANFAGLTDLMAAKNPATSTANWLAYGYGYDTSVTFSVAGGGVTLTGGAGSGNHFAGIPITGLSPGESYFAQVKVRVPTGSPDVQFTVGYKTSGHVMKIKDQDVTLALAFTADADNAAFGIEFPGAGPIVVKSMKVWVLNQRGYPAYIFDGSGWIETVHMAQKGDIYSRVNTFGNQVINGIKQFAEGLWVGPLSNVFLIAGSNNEAGSLPIMQVSQDNSAGGFAGMAIRGKKSATAVARSVGIILKHSDESSTGESNKSWEIASYSAAADAASPSLLLRNGVTGHNALVLDGATDAATFYGGVTAPSATIASELYYPARFAHKALDTFTSFAAAALPGTHIITSAQTDGPITGTYFMCLTTQYQSDTVWNQQEAWSPFGTSTGPDTRRWMRQMYGGSGNTWGPWVRIDNAAPPEAWTSVLGGIGFANSWTNYGSTYAGAQFRLVGDVVQLRGLIKSGTVNTNAFVLPVGYRPPYEHIFAAVSAALPAWTSGAASTGTAHTHSSTTPGAIAGRLNVSPSGAVVPSVVGNGYVSLDNVQFSITA